MIGGEIGTKMSDPFDVMRDLQVDRCFFLSDLESGLRAVLVIDDTTLGPAAGGIRTLAYPSWQDACRDAAALAHAMTLKLSISGLDGGGGKTVVLDHPGLNRAAAFRRLGEFVEKLQGLYHTAGDLGTTTGDLFAMAERTGYVRTSQDDLANATGRSVLAGIRACAALRDVSLQSLTIGIQGCGMIGAGVARILAAEGARLIVSDAIPERAINLAAEVNAFIVLAQDILVSDVDILAPCAAGGVITNDVAHTIKSWAVCGGANNQLAGDAGQILAERQIHFVPDILCSAGAAVVGIGGNVMGIANPGVLIESLEHLTLQILQESVAKRLPTNRIAERKARERIAARRTEKSNRRAKLCRPADKCR